MFTERQQLDNLIRWRDELASGKWKKCEGSLESAFGGHCAYGVAVQVFELPELSHAQRFMAIDEMTGFDKEDSGIIEANDYHPGDNFAAVIEYLNEEITRRKVALGVPVARKRQEQAA